MDRPRILKGLRIAASAVCLVVCVLLIVLWVRSYWRIDQIYGHISPTSLLNFGSMRGQVTFRRVKNYHGQLTKNWIPDGEPVSSIMQRRQQSFPNGQEDLLIYRFDSRFGFGKRRDGFYVPHWSLILLFAVATPLPFIKWRFSLRTLLIATTLIAVFLATAAALGLW